MNKKITFLLILLLCVTFKGYCIENILSSDVNSDLTELTGNTYANDDLNSSFNISTPTITHKIKHVTCLVDGVPSNDGAIDITANGYSGIVTYEWSTTDGSGLDTTAEDQTGLSAGTYYLTAYHNSNLCYNKVYVIKNPPQLDFTTIITHNVCYGELNGSIVINASGGGGNYEYSIDNGENFVNSNIFTGLPAGNYTVVVKDCKGCVVKKIVKIEEGSEISVSCPDDLTLESCLSQTEIDNAFSNWLSQFTFEGGINAVESGLANCTIPDACGGEVVVNYSVTDDCGTTKSCSATFNIEAPQVLVFENEAEDLTAECGSDNSDSEFLNWLSNNGNASLSGGCNVTWSNNFSESNWEATCGNAKSITVTFTATDACNQSIETTATYTYTDTTAPVFSGSLPGNITVSCASIPNPVNLTATDNCDNNVVVTFNETTSGQNDACGNEYIITRTWTAQDCAGNAVSHTQKITVEDTTDPVFSGTLPTDITVDCTSALPNPVNLTATDNCDNNVLVVFNETTSGQDDTCGSEYIITRTWTAQDCAGNSVSYTQTITVEDNTAPVFSGTLPANTTASCTSISEPVSLTATDNCDNNVVVAFNETTSGQDDSCGSEYIVTRTWTAQDCAGNSVSYTQTITVEDNTAPVFSGTLPSNITVNCSTVPNPVNLTATDNCDNNVVVAFNETTSGQDDSCGSEYIVTRTWTAQDCAGNAVSHTQKITVEDTTDPVFSGALPGNTTVSCASIPNPVNLTATDNCDNNVVVAFNETTSGQNDACGNEYIITRTWTAQDCAGNAVSHTQKITVEDTSDPVFSGTLPSNVTISCTTVLPNPVNLTATDNCDNDVEVVFNETISGQNDTCGSEYIVTRTWTAQDCAGNTVSHTQTINVEDTTAPVFSRILPARIIANCANVPNPVNLTATDNCDNNVVVNFNETTSGNGSCGSKYTITRIWTAQDCAGNTVSQTQTIIVEDTTAPVFTGTLPANITLNCDEDLTNIPILTAVDNCDNDVDIVFNEEIPDYNACAPEYSLIRTWTATDCAGHSTKHIQVIKIINDTSFPELITPLPAVINANCSNIPDAPQLEFEDSCFDGEIDIEFSEITQPNGNNSIRIIRTWVATTLCGDQAEFNQTINVNINYSIIPPSELCVDDIPVNLNNYLPAGIPQNGTWEAVSSNSNLQNSTFDPSVVPLGIHTFIYTTTTDNCPSKYELKINVHDDCIVNTCSSEDQVKISAAITPNGDPYNEYFEVTGVEECGFIIEVQIFNRWGNLVYQSSNYQNNWNGFSSSVAVGSNGKVPSGTYYYIVNLKNSGFPVFRASLLIAGT